METWESDNKNVIDAWRVFLFELGRERLVEQTSLLELHFWGRGIFLLLD